MNAYDVIIVGAGPAGIFAALELLTLKHDLRILMLEKGKDIGKRICPMKSRGTSCASCPECALLSGWGGAGAFSDGKLNLSPDIGGHLTDYDDRRNILSLIRYVDETYVRYGAPDMVYGKVSDELASIGKLASQHGLHFIPSQIRHIGTDRCPVVLGNIKRALEKKTDILFGTEADRLLVRKGAAAGVKLKDGRKFYAGFVILSPGREGSRWLEKEAKRLRLTLLKNPVDIGVRVEVPSAAFEPLTKISYEPKLVYFSRTFNDRVRTFCVNPYGEVVKEYLKGIWTVNGHSYAHAKTDKTNFALLVSTYFTEPFDEPILYGRYIAHLANLLGGGVIVQRLGDLRKGRRSTPGRIANGKVQPTLQDATPGDLSFVIPYRYLTDILEMLESLDLLAPGINSESTLLYGVEVKFYSMHPQLSPSLETEVTNLFAVGDGAGVSRGLVQASVSGVIAARCISTRTP